MILNNTTTCSPQVVGSHKCDLKNERLGGMGLGYEYGYIYLERGTRKVCELMKVYSKKLLKPASLIDTLIDILKHLSSIAR